ncbi:hypothetical protein [Solicola gregarius]|uniref:Ig-like domain-containing protein n=1 Tax=Solicola gregarius TaxID=2908642 RepID=A0AA46TLC7_9ACTN|nr:hypothetical protein [Solicola gregarius]UYM07054.1 hypothetical protein L0C25_08250 [Solicola gregarius]
MAIGRGLAAAAMLAAALTACTSSAGDEPDDPASTPSGSPKSESESGPPRVAGGVASPGSLTAFDCAADDAGAWSATGTLTNTESDPADFRVTIVVAPPDAASGRAREITVTDVPSGESTEFRAKKLPDTAGDDVACSVQVALLS